MIYLDTHVAVWLYLGDMSKFSLSARTAINEIASAIQQTWTRDPFDRMIVGHAVVQESRLVTKDDDIHDNYIHAIW